MSGAAIISLSGGTIALVACLMVLIHKLLARSDELMDHRAAQLDAQAIQKEAERQRDDALRQVKSLRAQVEHLESQLERATRLMSEYVDRTKEMIHGASGEDILALSRAVLGMRTKAGEYVSTPSDGSDAASGDDPGSAEKVSAPTTP